MFISCKIWLKDKMKICLFLRHAWWLPQHSYHSVQSEKSSLEKALSNFDLGQAMKRCSNLCEEGKHRHWAHRSRAVWWLCPSPSGPAWVQSESHMKLYLAVFILLVSLDLWPSKSKIIGRHWMSFISHVRGQRARAGKWVETEGMHDAMPWEGPGLQPSGVVYFCNRRLLGQLCWPVPSPCVDNIQQVM